MNRISFQWRITLMTAVLIAGACICLNLLLYHSGATGMDNLNGYVLQYQQNDDENLIIETPVDQMSDFLYSLRRRSTMPRLFSAARAGASQQQ